MIVSLITTKEPSLSSGSQVRNYYLIDELAKTKEIELHIFSPRISEDLLQRNKNIYYHQLVFPPRKLTQTILAAAQLQIPYLQHLTKSNLKSFLGVLGKSDVIQVQELDGFMVLSPVLSMIQAPIILDAHNVDYHRFHDEMKNKNPVLQLIGKLFAPVFQRREAEIVKKSNVVLSCSETDRKYFQQLVSPDSVFLIPNGVNTQQLSPSDRHLQVAKVLFMGSLDYLPNHEGLMYYLDRVHDLVRSQVPDYKLEVIGRGAEKLQAFHSDSVLITGFVDDVKEKIDEARVCICPLLSGSGTRLKLLEYFSMAKAVVSTTKGAEGIEVADGQNVLLRDDPNSFAAAVVELLMDNKQRKKLGTAARQLVIEKYDWHRAGKQLRDIYHHLANSVAS